MACVARSLAILCSKSRLLSQCNIWSNNRSCASRMSLKTTTSSGRSKEVSSLSSNSHQHFDYFVILDFEATCESKRQLEFVEIIEFAALLVQTKKDEKESETDEEKSNMQIKDQFHSFVRPQINAELSAFCVNLTGITQETVDESPTFIHVFQAFQTWMKDKKLVDQVTDEPTTPFAFITCGNWDLSSALINQSQFDNLTLPDYFSRWIDVKQSFFKMTGHWPRGLMDMLHRQGITPVGRHHSGIDDCRNLHLLVRDLASKGHVFEITNRLIR